MLVSERKKWTVSYFDDRIKAEMRKLPDGIRAGYSRLVEAMQLYGAELRMPHSRAIGDGLFELRPRGREGIGRVFYCAMIGRRIVILHSFVKKTQETPNKELRIAIARMKEVKTRG